MNLTESQQKELNRLLTQYGISLRHVGRIYIKDVIDILISDPLTIRSVHSKIYPLVAEKNNTRVSNVEKSIRNAHDKSIYKDNNPDATNKVLYMELLEKLQFIS